MYARWQLWHLKGLSLLCCRLWDWGGSSSREERESKHEEVSISTGDSFTSAYHFQPGPKLPAAEEGTPGSQHRDRTYPSSPPHLPHTCPFFSGILCI